MAQIVRLENPKSCEGVMPTKARTQTELEIRRSLDLIRSINGPAVTMISGAPGVGKTEALLNYLTENGQNAFYLSIAKGEGNPSHVASAILRQFGEHSRSGNDLSATRWKIGQYLGPRRILLIDEAQNLYQRNKASCTKGASFGWLVAASEESGFDLAFCGDLTLPTVLMDFPHLQSRFRRPVNIRAAYKDDVIIIAAQSGIIEAPALDLLCAVVRKTGGLRNVENVCRMATVFAGESLIGMPHLKAAIVDLKLDKQGVQ